MGAGHPLVVQWFADQFYYMSARLCDLSRRVQLDAPEPPEPLSPEWLSDLGELEYEEIMSVDHDDRVAPDVDALIDDFGIVT